VSYHIGSRHVGIAWSCWRNVRRESWGDTRLARWATAPHVSE